MVQNARGKQPAQIETADKRPLYVELTPDAYDGWADFCGIQGCTLTALIEALGQALHEPAPIDLHRLDPRFAAIVVAAREITAQRRRRKS